MLICNIIVIDQCKVIKGVVLSKKYSNEQGLPVPYDKGCILMKIMNTADLWYLLDYIGDKLGRVYSLPDNKTLIVPINKFYEYFKVI